MSKITKVEFKVGQKSIDSDTVLEGAKNNYSSVFVVGWDNEGFLDVRSTNNLDQKEILWLVELFKHKLLSGDYAPD